MRGCQPHCPRRFPKRRLATRTLLVVQYPRRTARKSTAPYSGRSFPESSRRTPCRFPTLRSPTARLMAHAASIYRFSDVRSGSRLCKNPIDAMIPLLNRGGMMKGFVQGADRQQTTLLPECLDGWVDESNPVRAVDVFIDALKLRELGFEGVTPAATGRPGCHPSPMPKLYIYGY